MLCNETFCSTMKSRLNSCVGILDNNVCCFHFCSAYLQHIKKKKKKKNVLIPLSGKSQGNLAYCQGNLECFVNVRELLGNFENTIFKSSY